MLVFVIWTFTLIVLPGLAMAAATLAESSWNQGVLATTRSRLLAAAACVLLLLVIAVAYESDALASPDGNAVSKVTAAPDSGLAKLMTFVTLLGDSVPSFLLATVLGIILLRRGISPYLCAILPLVVLAELYAQLGMWKVFSDTTIGSLHPHVPIGGVGQIPSGSVARLLSIFLVGAVLMHTVDEIWARRLVTLGVVLTTIQMTSRLVLGRHLYADLVAGVVLGLLLVILAMFVIFASRADPRFGVRRRPF